MKLNNSLVAIVVLSAGLVIAALSGVLSLPQVKAAPPANAEGKPDEWFPVTNTEDAFSEKSVIDMSSLVPAPAGQFGFLKRNGENLKFEKADKPVKFWGCGLGVDLNAPKDELTRRVKYLRKHGVNMGRMHVVSDGFLGPLANGEFDKDKIDKFDWWFAELKKNGIYSDWSVFWWVQPVGEYDSDLLAELGKGPMHRTYGLVNISRPLQDARQAYLRKLLEHVNPYTKLAYKDDPALAVMEIQNEDCVFFANPLNSLAGGKPPKHAALLRKMFCEWAKQKYKTDDELQKAWGTKDSLSSGELKLCAGWELGGKEPDSRKGDFVRFMTDVQKGYYERYIKGVRDAGYKGIMVTSAWRAAVAAADPANLYCDYAGDMIDRHNYFADAGFRIAAGNVKNETHMDKAGSGLLSSGLYQVEDRPFAISEWKSFWPNPWMAESVPLMAFYGMGLQGWDSSSHFLNVTPKLLDKYPRGTLWIDDLLEIGQYPAVAFAIYKNHIKEGPIAAARRLKVDDLFMGIDPLNQDFTGGGWDQKSVKGNAATPPEVLAIGRVTVSFDGGKNERADWDKYWDKSAKIVKSMTGELTWDMDKKVVTVSSPKTQGVIGFAGGGTYDLPGASVEVQTKFVSLIFTPLDDEELAKSKHILITAVAKTAQTGAEYSDDYSQLKSLGKPPLLMEPVQAKITLKGDAPAKVNVLDIFGVPTGGEVKAEGASFTIDGRYKTCYYEIVR